MAERIGLFGGTFDPPHIAHLALAGAALVELDLDQVRWIPAGQPWQKARTVTPAAHREAMVRAAIAVEPRFVLDRIELERAGPSYTIDTLQAMRASRPGAEWFLIIGSDQYAGIQTWRGWQELLSLVTLAVARRPGPVAPVNAAVLHHAHRVVPLPMLGISSTEIRSRVSRGLPIDAMVPPSVARYIDQHHLYKG